MERKPSKFASATSNQVSAKEASGEKPESVMATMGTLRAAAACASATVSEAQFFLGQPADGVDQDIPYTEFSEGIGHVGRDGEGSPKAQEIDGFGLAQNLHRMVEFLWLEPFLQALERQLPILQL